MMGSVPKVYVHDGPGSIARLVLERCTALKQPFTPTPWALNGHAQVRARSSDDLGCVDTPGFDQRWLRSSPTHDTPCACGPCAIATTDTAGPSTEPP